MLFSGCPAGNVNTEIVKSPSDLALDELREMGDLIGEAMQLLRASGADTAIDAHISNLGKMPRNPYFSHAPFWHSMYMPTIGMV